MSGFQITNSPVASLMDAALVVGTAREDDGALKVYLGARYRNVYVVVSGPDADAIERAYNGAGSHLWIKPAPSGEFLCMDEEEAA